VSWSQASPDSASRSFGGTRVHTRFTVRRPTRSVECCQPKGDDEADADKVYGRRAEEPRSSCDPLQRLDKRDVVRIRNLEHDLDTERRQRGLSPMTSRRYSRKCCGSKQRSFFSRPRRDQLAECSYQRDRYLAV